LAAGSSDPHHHSSRSILALNGALAVTSNREAVRVPEQSVESSASAVEWAAIAGGALAAIGVSIIISTLASGEIFFRDTAHGFLAWALATILVAALLSLAAAATVAGSSVGADATVTPEAAEQARKAAASFSLSTSVSFLIGAFIASASPARWAVIIGMKFKPALPVIGFSAVL
jgi:hypothetical protein